jgi:hypothetical protein
MDWNEAIAYGQLVNAAHDDSAGKPPATPGYNVVERIYANDLATEASRQRGAPVAIVAMGLILQAQASGDVVIAIRGTEGGSTKSGESATISPYILRGPEKEKCQEKSWYQYVFLTEGFRLAIVSGFLQKRH